MEAARREHVSAGSRGDRAGIAARSARTRGRSGPLYPSPPGMTRAERTGAEATPSTELTLAAASSRIPSGTRWPATGTRAPARRLRAKPPLRNETPLPAPWEVLEPGFHSPRAAAQAPRLHHEALSATLAPRLGGLGGTRRATGYRRGGLAALRPRRCGRLGPVLAGPAAGLPRRAAVRAGESRLRVPSCRAGSLGCLPGRRRRWR